MICHIVPIIIAREQTVKHTLQSESIPLFFSSRAIIKTPNWCVAQPHIGFFCNLLKHTLLPLMDRHFYTQFWTLDFIATGAQKSLQNHFLWLMLFCEDSDFFQLSYHHELHLAFKCFLKLVTANRNTLWQYLLDIFLPPHFPHKSIIAFKKMFRNEGLQVSVCMALVNVHPYLIVRVYTGKLL